MDLNRATVEYVCTRFQSPHLSRRYGHKLYTEEDPYLQAMRALSEVQYVVKTVIHSPGDFSVG